MYLYETENVRVSEGRNDECALGERQAVVIVNKCSFNIPEWRTFTFTFTYRNTKRFNVSPPDFLRASPTVYGAIKDLPLRDFANTLLPEESEICKRLPNGWTFADLQRYSPQLDFTNCRTKIRRLNFFLWSMPFDESSEQWIHPKEHRNLSYLELQAISGIPNGSIYEMLHSVPTCIIEWLQLQADYCETDAWQGEDYESSYNWKTEAWEGGDTSGKPVKTFDLTYYVNKTAERPAKTPKQHYIKAVKNANH